LYGFGGIITTYSIYTVHTFINSGTFIVSTTPFPTPTSTVTPTMTPTNTVTPTKTPTMTPTPTEPYFLLFEDGSIATSENNNNIEIDVI
jgi:hypothetical protein